MAGDVRMTRVSIDGRFERIGLVERLVDNALAGAGLCDDVRYGAGVAVGEAVANAIEHGSRRDPQMLVDVEIAISDIEAVIRVTDQGDGFDVQSVGDPTSPRNQLEPSGRGLLLMRTFMDEVEYRFGTGTSITLRKQLPDPKVAAGAPPSSQLHPENLISKEPS